MHKSYKFGQKHFGFIKPECILMAIIIILCSTVVGSFFLIVMNERPYIGWEFCSQTFRFNPNAAQTDVALAVSVPWISRLMALCIYPFPLTTIKNKH